MSILTWQQVTAPDFSTAQRANERAQDLILGGIAAAKQVPASIDATRQAVRGIEQDFTNQQVALELQNATTPEAIDRLVKQGMLQGNFGGKTIVDPSMISPEIVGQVSARRDKLLDTRNDAEEARAATAAFKLAPNDLSAATNEINNNQWRNAESAGKVAQISADLARGKEALAAAALRGTGKGGKKKDDVPSEWKNLAESLRLPGDVRGAVRFFGGLSSENRILLRKGFEAVGATEILAAIKDGGAAPSTGNRNYSAGMDSKRMSIRHSNILGIIRDAKGLPPPGYDFEGNPTSDLPPTYGEVVDYDNNVVRPSSNHLPKGKDSGASGMYMMTPTTRARAAEKRFGKNWRTSHRQTMENEYLLGEWVWNNEGGAKPWKTSLEPLLKQAGIDTPAEEYFKGRTWEEMAPMISALETGMLPDDFQSKIEALQGSIAERSSKFSTGVERIIQDNLTRKEGIPAAAERVAKNLTGLGGTQVNGTVIMEFMENLLGHANKKLGIQVSAGELADLVLGSVQGDMSLLTWTDVASNFDIRAGKAETQLKALPAARKAVEDLNKDAANLAEAQAIRAKYDTGKTALAAGVEEALLTPAKMKGLYSKFLPVNNASGELREIFKRPGADQTRAAPPLQELGMPADRSVPAGSAAPLDGSEPKADPGQQAGLRTLAKEGEDPRKTRFREALSKNASQDLFGPKSAVDREKNKILTETVDKKKTALDRLLKVHTGVKDTPEIAKARRELESATFDASVEKGLSALRSGLANNEPDEIIKLREARVKDQSERDYEVSEEEFLDRYMKKFETPSGPSAADTTRAIIEQVKARQARRAAGEAIAAEDARAIALKKAGAALDFDLTPPEDPAAAKSAQQAALDEIDDLELVPSRATQKREARQKVVLEQLDAEVGVIPGKGAQYGARRKVASEADAVTAELEKELGNIPGKGAEQAARKRAAREKAAAAELDAELEKEVGNLPGKGAERAARKRRDRILKEAAEEAEAKLKAVREARKNRR